ncbi:MAG UNVERIFIED_CONTAM: metal-dependent hydrolase [Planctomycetaceae bacterium]|jgi:L-ascorbate metabolism protein UlaG (beta-lactamase superfamily)
MTTTLTYYGHSAFLLQTAGRSVLIDPFLTGNPQATVSAADVHADYIVISHGHGDHVGDVVEIAKRTHAMVISNHEISLWLKRQGVPRTHDMHIGGSHRFSFGTLKLTIAHHGSILPDGSCGGSPAGLLFQTAAGNIYHAGDTGLFGDMALIGEAGLKLAILPIGDNYTMGPADSLRAIRLLQPEIVMPCHVNTFPVIEQDVASWSDQVRKNTTARPVVLQPGQLFSL